MTQRLLTPQEALEKDVNAAVKQLLNEMEIAARTPPVDACEPYACDDRRKKVIRIVWSLYKKVRAASEVDDGTE